MTRDITARLVLGGRVSGQTGFYPGVAEEAALALQAEVPLFPVGAFGGCGRLVIDAMRGRMPTEFSLEYQLEHTSGYEELLVSAGRHGSHPDFESLQSTFASARWPELRNGLRAHENERLAITDDIDEIIALFLRGLRSLS